MESLYRDEHPLYSVSMSNFDAELQSQIVRTIDILEGLENLIDTASTPEIAEILQDAWLKVSDTFPEDFKEATRWDAGAGGLRLYLRVKAFFENPIDHPITQAELEAYYHSQTPIDEDSADFFFPD